MSREQGFGGRRALALTAAALGVVGLVVACGGSDDAGPAGPAGPGALLVDAASPFKLPPAGTSEYQLHLMHATANAGAGPFTVPDAPANTALYDAASLRKQWCYTAENTGAPPDLADRTVVPATKLFDNMWAFGLRTVLQYAIQTEDGKVFLIDTLNNTSEAQTITEPSLKAVGLQPTQLIGAMPTHGHGDHHGGASYLQKTYGIPIYLGSGDVGVGANAANPFTVTPVIDSAATAPVEKVFGGTTFTVLSTPGHTPGTVSGIVPVKYKGQIYRLAFWGGTSMPNAVATARQYLDGSERLYKLSVEKKIDGTMHTHPFVDGSLAKIDALRNSPNPDRNPFLIGNSLALRSLATLRECSAAKLAQVDATARNPVWNTTTTEVTQASFAGSNAVALVSATVRNPYGWLQNGKVTFTAAPRGETCTAYTDARGEARCSLSTSGATSVRAEFAGFTLADGAVQLASGSSAAFR